VPEALIGTACGGPLRDPAIGFYGKIPGRGDFVQAGLPRAFVDPWDAWMRRMIVTSRSVLGEGWLPAWLEAAVWRFALSPGVCGPDSVLGLWMPSVDSVGRYFPLTLAAVGPDLEAAALMHGVGGFLAAAECAGRAALADDLPPEELTARLVAAVATPPGNPACDLVLCPAGGGLWWTEGGPRVSAESFTSAGLPDEDTFVAMLVSCCSNPPAFASEHVR